MIPKATACLRCLLVALSLPMVAAAADAFPAFQCHEIAQVGQSMGQTSLVDVDKDGDLEICTKPWRGNLHVFLRNTLVP